MSAKPEEQLISTAETWLAHSKELATLTLYEQRINRVLTRNKTEFSSLQASRIGAAVPVCSLPATQGQTTEAEAQSAESISETSAPEWPDGFVHSSDVPPSIPDPLPPAANQPVPSPAPDSHPDPGHEAPRWLRSFEQLQAATEQPATPAKDLVAAAAPLPSPPTAARPAA
jgi:hypothetical protein